MRLDVLKAMNAARRERRAGALVTRLSDGDERYVAAEDFAADPLAEPLEAALRAGQAAARSTRRARTISSPCRRRRRGSTMIGAVHISPGPGADGARRRFRCV